MARQAVLPPEPTLPGERLGFSVLVPSMSKHVKPPIHPKKLGDEEYNTQQFVSSVLQRTKLTQDAGLLVFLFCFVFHAAFIRVNTQTKGQFTQQLPERVWDINRPVTLTRPAEPAQLCISPAFLLMPWVDIGPT